MPRENYNDIKEQVRNAVYEQVGSATYLLGEEWKCPHVAFEEFSWNLWDLFVISGPVQSKEASLLSMEAHQVSYKGKKKKKEKRK